MEPPQTLSVPDRHLTTQASRPRVAEKFSCTSRADRQQSYSMKAKIHSFPTGIRSGDHDFVGPPKAQDLPGLLVEKLQIEAFR
jgi:hypothetical protein